MRIILPKIKNKKTKNKKPTAKGVALRDFLGHYKRIAKNFAILFFLLCKTHDLTGLSIVCYTFENLFAKINNSINWNLLCQHFDCFFLGGNKKYTLAFIALIDKIFERFAGITRVIAINCNASTIVGVLLQNLTSKASAEDEKVLND